MGKRAKKEGEKGQKQGAQAEDGDLVQQHKMEHRPAFTGQPVIMSISDLHRILYVQFILRVQYVRVKGRLCEIE